MNKYSCGVFAFYFLVMLSSCEQSSKEEIIEGHILIDTKKNQDIKASDFLSDIKVIELSSSKDAFLGKLDKIKIYNDTIYILDIQHTHTVKAFDLEGKYLFALKTSLEDTDHEIEIIDFDISEQGELFVLDGRRQIIHQFNSTGGLLKSLPLKFYAHKFVYQNNSFIFFKNKFANNGESEDNFYDILITNRAGKIRNRYKPFQIPEGEFTRFSPNEVFSKLSSTLLYTEFLNDTIFQINDGMLKYKYLVNFLDANLSKEEKKLDFKKLKSILLDPQRNIAFGQTNINENEEVLFFQYIDKQKPAFFLYDKNRQKKIYARRIIDDFNQGYMPPLVSLSKEYLISVLDELELEKMGDIQIDTNVKFKKIYDNVVKKGTNYIYLSKLK
jgi:hypothetical protein